MDKPLYYLANARLPTEKAHGIQIMKTCEALAGQEAKLKLIVPRRHNHLSQDPFIFYGVEPNFTIHYAWCLDFLWFPLFKSISFWLIRKTFGFSVKRYLRRLPPGILYTREADLAAVLPPENLFYEIHTIPQPPHRREREAWQRARGLVVISDGIKNELLNYGVPESKILLARDGFDLKHFLQPISQETARQKLSLPLDRKIVLYTGHLYDWKGAEVLAKAAHLNERKDVDFYFVGGTAKEISRFRQQYSGEHIHIIGWRPPAEIVWWLKSANVLVLPNSKIKKIGSIYTSPLKLFEYMAAGKPIVAANVPALAEVLSPFYPRSVYFNPDDANSLAQAISHALNNLGSLNHKNFSIQNIQEFSWDNRAKKILDFLCAA